jgi:hypothetical protein
MDAQPLLTCGCSVKNTRFDCLSQLYFRSPLFASLLQELRGLDRGAVMTKPTSLKDVMALKLTEHRVEHLNFFPTMTSWFKPILLSKLLLSVIISETFGQYADRRLVHAALDKQPVDASRAETDVMAELKNSSGDVWIDFVADLGDGFDATYSIAYLLAQPELKVNGCEDATSRSRFSHGRRRGLPQ